MEVPLKYNVEDACMKDKTFLRRFQRGAGMYTVPILLLLLIIAEGWTYAADATTDVAISSAKAFFSWSWSNW